MTPLAAFLIAYSLVVSGLMIVTIGANQSVSAENRDLRRRNRDLRAAVKHWRDRQYDTRAEVRDVRSAPSWRGEGS